MYAAIPANVSCSRLLIATALPLLLELTFQIADEATRPRRHVSCELPRLRGRCRIAREFLPVLALHLSHGHQPLVLHPTAAVRHAMCSSTARASAASMARSHAPCFFQSPNDSDSVTLNCASDSGTALRCANGCCTRIALITVCHLSSSCTAARTGTCSVDREAEVPRQAR